MNPNRSLARHAGRLVALVGAVGLVVSACGSGAVAAAPGTSPTPAVTATPATIGTPAPSLAPSAGPPALVIPDGWVIKTGDDTLFNVASPTYVFVQEAGTFISGPVQDLERIALVLYDRRPESLGDGTDTVQLGMPPSGAKVTAAGLAAWVADFGPRDAALDELPVGYWQECGAGTPFEVHAGPGIMFTKIVPRAVFKSQVDLALYEFFIATDRGVLVGYAGFGAPQQAGGEQLLQGILGSLSVS